MFQVRKSLIALALAGAAALSTSAAVAAPAADAEDRSDEVVSFSHTATGGTGAYAPAP